MGSKGRMAKLIQDWKIFPEEAVKPPASEEESR